MVQFHTVNCSPMRTYLTNTFARQQAHTCAHPRRSLCILYMVSLLLSCIFKTYNHDTYAEHVVDADDKSARAGRSLVNVSGH